MLKQFSLLLIAKINAGNADYNYLKQGADWNSSSEWVCGSGNQQSPIDFNGKSTKIDADMYITGRGYTNSPSAVVYLEKDTVKMSPIIDGIL